LPSEAYGGSFPTTPIPGCMSYWISWALITGCTHGLQVRASSDRLEGRRLKKTTGSTGQGCEMVGAERAIKPFVIGRKNWLFSNTPRGARTSAILYSIVETAKENGLKPF